MNFERERISNTLVEAMLYHDCATGMVVQTLHQVRKLYEECVMENYTSTFKVYHDYPEKEGHDLFEMGIRFDTTPNETVLGHKLYEWVPFLPVYVKHGSTELEVRKAFQASVEKYKIFDLKVGSELIIDSGVEGIFRVDIVTPLAVYGEFVDVPNNADWVSWASITGVLS